MTPFISQYQAIDAAIVAKGFPPTSPWWIEQLTRFYASTCRQLVLRCGRRGGKSSTLCRVAVCEALFGEHVILPGDTGIVGIVSVSRDEAAQRLRTIKAILDALRVRYHERADAIELEHRPIVFRVFTGSIAGVVGGTWIGALCDEVARWRDADTGANPAREVLASLRPTMATMPHARLFLSSSPFGSEDAHAIAFEAGDTSHQLVAYAPTWVANPTVSKQATHDLEPEPRIWAREYQATPSDSTANIWPDEYIDPCFQHDDKALDPISNACLLLDWAGSTDSSGNARIAGDDCVACFAFWASRPAKMMWLLDDKGARIFDAYGAPQIDPRYSATEEPVLCVRGITTFERGTRLRASDIVSHLSEIALSHGVTAAIGDERESFGLQSLFSLNGVAFHSLATSTASKHDSVIFTTRLMREQRLSISPHDKMQLQMRRFKERILPSGLVTYGGRGTAVDDHVSVLLLGARAELAGFFMGSPNHKSRRAVIDGGVGWVRPGQKAG